MHAAPHLLLGNWQKLISELRLAYVFRIADCGPQYMLRRRGEQNGWVVSPTAFANFILATICTLDGNSTGKSASDAQSGVSVHARGRYSFVVFGSVCGRSRPSISSFAAPTSSSWLSKKRPAEKTSQEERRRSKLSFFARKRSRAPYSVNAIVCLWKARSGHYG